MLKVEVMFKAFEEKVEKRFLKLEEKIADNENKFVQMCHLLSQFLKSKQRTRDLEITEIADTSVKAKVPKEGVIESGKSLKKLFEISYYCRCTLQLIFSLKLTHHATSAFIFPLVSALTSV